MLLLSHWESTVATVERVAYRGARSSKENTEEPIAKKSEQGGLQKGKVDGFKIYLLGRTNLS